MTEPSSISRESSRAPTVHDVADYFLVHQDHSAEPITNKKLQKLVYLAQGTTLAMLHRSLWDTTVLGARVTAYSQGPVVPDLWRKYKAAQWNPLPIPSAIDLDVFDAASLALMDAVLNTYGRLTADQLTRLTHTHEPWVTTRAKAQQNRNNDVIPESDLSKFFAGILAGPNDPRALSPKQLAAAMRSKPEWAAEDARGASEIAAGQGLGLMELRRFLDL